MKHFKNGDYVDIYGLDKPVIKAIEARFVADGYEGFEKQKPKENIGVVDGELLFNLYSWLMFNHLTVEQVLFAGAPNWAIDVREWEGACFWTDGVKWRQMFDDEFESVIGKVASCKTIYTRQKARPIKTVADAAEHFKNRWPEHGNSMYYDGEWVVVQHSSAAVTKEQFTRHVKEKSVKYFDGFWGDSICNFIYVDLGGRFKYTEIQADYLIDKNEFEQIAKEIYFEPKPKPEQNWHERGEIPPVGEIVDLEGKRVEVIAHDTSKDFKHQFCVRFQDGQIAILNNFWIGLIQKKQTIDMSLFAGSGVWITNGLCTMQADEDITLDTHFRPVFDVWNHFDGGEMPTFLDQFTYSLRYWTGSTFAESKNTKFIEWSRVCEFKITGLKENYEYPKK